MNSRKIIWKPSAKRRNSSSMKHFMDWLENERDLRFTNYNELWVWSVNNLERFWKSIWDYFGLRSSTAFSEGLDKEKMPGALWFKGATVNIVYEIFKDYEEIKESLKSFILKYDVDSIYMQREWTRDELIDEESIPKNINTIKIDIKNKLLTVIFIFVIKRNFY